MCIQIVDIISVTVDILLFPLSEIGIVKKHLKFGWDFNTYADFTADTAKEIDLNLRKKFGYWNTKLKTQHNGTPFCVTAYCSDVTIKVYAIKKDYRINIEICSVA